MVSKKMSAAAASVAAHLRPEGLKFLRGIARNNDRDWFVPRKAIFEAELKEPMLAIIRKVTDAMMDFAPDFVRPAEKCLFIAILASATTSGPTRRMLRRGGRTMEWKRPPGPDTTSTSAPRRL
jgi:hypothetical protein